MAKKDGIPKDILDELNIEKEDKEKPLIVKAIVQPHQVRLPIPAQLNLEINLRQGQKLKLVYDKEKKEIRYKL